MTAWVPGPDCPLSDPRPDPALRLAWNCAGCLVRRRTWLPHVKARKNKQKTQQDKTTNKTQNQQTAKIPHTSSDWGAGWKPGSCFCRDKESQPLDIVPSQANCVFLGRCHPPLQRETKLAIEEDSQDLGASTHTVKPHNAQRAAGPTFLS